MSTHQAVAERAALNDEQLMAAVEAGCVVAFDVLYGRYRHRAHRVARSVCRDEGRAQEAVQEAFMSIWRRRVKLPLGTVKGRIRLALERLRGKVAHASA